MRRFLVPLGVVGLLLLSALKLTEWTSESWWFEALGQRGTFVRLMAWKSAAFLVFGALWSLILAQHTRLAWSYVERWRSRLQLLGPSVLPSGFDGGLHWATRLFIGFSAFVAGLSGATRFDLWVLLFSNREIETPTAPNLSFYLFTLPALSWIWNWFGLALLCTFALVIFVYLATDTLETGSRVLRTTPEVSHHLAVLAGLFIVWLGLKSGLNILSAPIVSGGSVEGLHGPLEQTFGDGTRRLFFVSSLGVAILVWYLAAQERARLAWSLFFSWMLGAWLLPLAAPVLARSSGVHLAAQQESVIETHLQTTRRVWGLENKNSTVFDWPVSTLADAPSFEGTDPREEKQFLWPSLALRDELRRLLVRQKTVNPAASGSIEAVHFEENASGVPIGRAVVQNRSARQASVALVVEADVSQSGPLEVLSQQTLDDVLLVEAAKTSPRPEPGPPREQTARFPSTTAQWRTTPETSHAIARDDFGRCGVLSVRFLNFALLPPGLPVSWHLTPEDRARALAPFVYWSQAGARPFVLPSGNGPRLFYVLDGLFGSRFYPGSASLLTNDEQSGLNYLRHNVIAVFDATSGEAHFYLLDENEPFAQVYQAAFPDVFEPIKNLRPELRAQIRPAPELLNATATIASRYHPSNSQDEAKAWKEQGDNWQPLWNELARDSPWRQVNLSNGGEAQVCAFSPLRHFSDDAKLSGLALTFDAGEKLIARQGQPKWQFLQAREPLELPEFVRSASRDWKSVAVEPTLFSIWPSFHENKLTSLSLLRATAKKEREKPWRLLLQTATTVKSSTRAKGQKSDETTLLQLRQVWRDLKAARRKGNWDEVGRLEKSLDSTLAIQ